MSPPATQPAPAGESVPTVSRMPIDPAQDPPPPTGGRSAHRGQSIAGRLADGTLVTGAINNLRSTTVDGKLTLTGTLTLTDPPGGSQQFRQTLTLSQLYVNTASTVLILDLGTLDLDQIGSTIKLIPVELTIEPDAESGSASLLPGMFGWLAGLLDNEGPVERISTLLNRTFTSLGLRH